MKLLTFFLCFALTGIVFSCYSQNANVNLNSVAPPSANASSQASLGQYNVNLYTGRLNYSAKICDFSTSKMTLPIGVSYASSGIKVQEMDGPVGIGWRLNCGGLITRSIRSAPDESANGYCGPNRIGYNNNRYYSNANQTWINNVMNNDNTKTSWDSEPDQFSFSFLGFSGVFVLDPDGNPVLQSSYGLKIVYSPFNRVTGTMTGGNQDWIVQDMAGNQYYFGDNAVETSNATLNGLNTNNVFSYTYISSWYISKIITADNQVINFQYQSFPQQSYVNTLNIQMAYLDPTNNNNIAYRYYNENTNVFIPTPIYLSKIISSTCELDFIYNQISPYNSQNSPYLVEVDALQNGLMEYKYQLNYSSIIYTGFYTRQLLSNIKQISVVSGNPITIYNFGYNTSIYLPTNNSIQTDYWGYYNSNPGLSDIDGYRGCSKTPDPVRTAANILTSVTNAYGGTTAFTYQQNDYGGTESSLLIGGLRVQKISTAINGVNSATKSYSYLDPSTQVSSGWLYKDPYDTQEELAVDQYTFSHCVEGTEDLAGVEVGYSWITVTNEDGSAVRYHFTNFLGYDDFGQSNIFSTNNYSTTAMGSPDAWTPDYPQTSHSFVRGKLLSEEDIDANNNVVKKTTNAYSFSTPISDVIWIKVYPYYPGPLSVLNSNSQYSIHKADFSTQDFLLTSKTETNNFYTNGTLTGSNSTSENYTYTTYNSNNFIASKTRVLSNGNTEKTTYRYPFNVLTSVPTSTASTSLPLSYLTQNNIISQPTEVVTSVINFNTGVETVLGVSLTRYATTAYGTVKPSSQYRLKTSQSLLKSNYISYTVTPGTNSETETIDLTNLEPTQFFTQYDSNGNLIESNNPYTTNGQSASLWGYGQNYQIAQVKNAKSNEFYYTSFEEWVLSNVIPGAAHTGTRYYSNTTYTPGWVIPDTKSYVISYWYLLGGVWKYSGIQNYTGSSMVLANANATGYDDICIYPSDALMTTYTYEPLVGMTSSEDNKGQTTSYQYDDYKRLINVLDMNGNIVKNYTYYINGQ